MISKEELVKIAGQTELPLYQQEKDYFLKLFIYSYYRHFQDAIFKGGTCLKYLLGLERFSEDLDFNIKEPTVFKKQVKAVLKDMQRVGINSYFLNEELFADSYTCEIGFAGPLYQGTKQTQNKFRIDAGYRSGTVMKPAWKLIKSEYPETGENFLVLAMDLQEMMVEKIMALCGRKKGRDLYDLWFLISAGIPLNQSLLQKRAKKEHLAISASALVSKSDYLRDMSRLSRRVIPYEQIRKEVLKLLPPELRKNETPNRSRAAGY